MRSLAEDHNIIFKPADKSSCLVVWDWEHYLAKADRQLLAEEIKEIAVLWMESYLN